MVRTSHVKFQEHFRDYKYANNKSMFAEHLLDIRHSIGSMESIKDVINTTNEVGLLDTTERVYIYRETQNNSQINDRNTAKINIIFEIITLEHTVGSTPLVTANPLTDASLSNGEYTLSHLSLRLAVCTVSNRTCEKITYNLYSHYSKYYVQYI
jgi:hypothetical protein